MRPSDVLYLSMTTANLVIGARLRAGIPHHRDLVRRLDLKASSHDDNGGFVQIGPGAGNGAGATTTFPITSMHTATPTRPSLDATKDDAAQWLSFDANGTSVPIPNEVNLVGTGGSASVEVVDGSARNDVQGAQSMTQQEQQRPSSTSISIPTQPAGGLGPQTQEEVERWIKAHNEARKAHGAGELIWREDLSWGAKSNAERCTEGHT